MSMEIINEALFANWGGIVTFILVSLEYANFPLPSEVVLPMVGLLASKYKLNLVMLIIISIIAGLFGSLLNYWIGFKYGEKVLNILSIKFKFLDKPLSSAKIYMNKYGVKSVFCARVIPIARTAISLVAGAYRVSLKKFITYTSTGVLIWNTFLILLGFFLGDNLDMINSILLKYTQGCILILAVILLGVYLMKRIKKDS